MIPALYLDRIHSRHKRHKRRKLHLNISIVTGLLAIAVHLLIPGKEDGFVRGMSAVSSFTFAAYVWKSMLEAMHLSLYAASKTRGKDYWNEFAKQYGILRLPFAKEALLRLGISRKDISGTYEITGTGDDFESFIANVFSHNQELRAFLEKHAITKQHWVGVWTWLEKRERDNVESAFILDDEHLMHLPSIGDAFSYGQTFTLSRVGHEMSSLSLPQSLEHFYARAFSLLEQSLRKSQGANVIIISQSVDDGEEYVEAFIPHMSGKKFIELDTEELISIKDAAEFENLFTKALKEAAHSGNVILVIPHITSLISAAHAIGYDAALTLGEYMRSPHLHIVMIADRQEFHATLETNFAIIQGADKIELDAIAPEILQSVAESEVLKIESRYGIMFSYQALTAITAAVLRYGSDHMHDTLRDYLDEIAIYNRKYNKKNRYISEEIVKAYVAEKTGTKGTYADDTDESKPVDVTEVLTRRVKGQENAIDAVARALERVRAGLGSAKRPLGTFLFLGPTGVGKTETAKALAEAYFGTEDKMTRFDMSEFSDMNAIARLIGSFESGEVGMLAAKARDAGHGVMLFDEIEKAHEKVRDLMLQILDEGYFTDARGGKVNMKNFIMIATSNAGSDLIYAAGKAIDKKELINHIIEQGVFKPEFLNRFDEVAVFSPLADRQLALIITLKLEKYAAELYEKKAIHLSVSPDIVEYIMSTIENKAFGGREIQRAIQNHVESLIAKDLLQGKAQAGSNAKLICDKEAKKCITVYT